MIYLLSAVIFGSLFSVIFKVCQKMGIDSAQVILFNYVTAMIASLVPISIKLLAGKACLADYSIGWESYLLTFIQGFLFLLGFISIDNGVRSNGVALTTVCSKASLILPVILGWALLSQPSPAWLPVAVVLVALVLIVLPSQPARKGSETNEKMSVLALVSVFLCYGISDFWMKVSQMSVQTQDQLDFLTGMIFVFASLLGFRRCYRKKSFKKSPVGKGSLMGGIALGFVNILCTTSCLRALKSVDTGIFYPVYNIGIVICATLAGVIAFKEKLNSLQIVGIALSAVAIFLFFK